MPALQVEAERPLGFTKRRPELLVVSDIETSARLHSQIPLAALTPLTGSPAIPSQANPIDKQSLGLDQLVLKLPNDGDIQRYSYGAPNLMLTLGVVRHSPKRLVARGLPIPKPVSPRAHSCSI